MLIPSKFNGYSQDGIRIYHIGDGGGGGGSGTQTQVVDLPEWAKPTAQKQLGLAESVTDINKNPFQSYGDFARKRGMDPTQVAGFTGLQNRAFTGAENLQPSGAIGAGMGITGAAANRALNMQYDPTQADYMQTQAPQLQQFQMGPAERVRADMFGGRQAEQYMSPYIEQAMAPQLREAQRSSEMMRNQNQAQAVQQGAFGGSRQAIVEAERQRNLGTQMGDIRARGLQSAYEQAQNQFNQDAARRLQAQQLNQQAGLTVGGQNLQAQLGTQQLGTQTGMQSQLANQQAFQNARQLAEQSRQFGGSLGMQGIQAALQGAGQLGQLGGQQFAQQKDVIGMQNQMGTQQQQQEQALINARMQDFQAQQRYPYQQLEFMSNILRGTPMGTVQSLYTPPPSTAQTVASLGLGAAGLSKLFAEGGLAKGMAAGGMAYSNGGGLGALALNNLV